MVCKWATAALDDVPVFTNLHIDNVSLLKIASSIFLLVLQDIKRRSDYVSLSLVFPSFPLS